MLLIAALATSWPTSSDEPRDGRLDLTDPVICEAFLGFRDLEVRDDAEFTVDQKLQIYYEPINYLIVRDPDSRRYRAHLVEDARLRRKGSKRVLHRWDAIIDHEPEADDPPSAIYLVTNLSLKGLRPGDYEVDLILRDALAEGEPPAERTVAFRVVAAPDDGDG